MKNTKKLFGIIAIIAIIGLLFVGCDEPSGKGPGSGEGTGEETWPPVSISLTAGVWENGEITEATKSIWYKFPISKGKLYRVWWNDIADGDGDKTLDVQVSAFYLDEDVAFENINAAWNTARSIAATADDTIFIKVMPKTEGETGTFGIVFVEGELTLRPGTIVFPDPVDMETLTLNTWNQLEFTSTVQEIWYKVTDLTSLGYYHFWWNDSKEGNGDATVDVDVTAWTGGKSSIFPRTDSGWTNPQTVSQFDIFPSNTIYVRVTPKIKGAAGTLDFNCVFSSSSSAPAWPFLAPKNASEITAAKWRNGTINENASGELWYIFTVETAGTYLWWNDSNQGNGAAELDVQVNTWKNNGTSVSISNADSAWTKSSTMSGIAIDDKIYARVKPKTKGETGTFDITYTTTDARPWLSSSKTAPLTKDQWFDGEITSESRGEEWHSFPVQAGETYYIWGNSNILYTDYNYNYGDGTKTLNVLISVFDDTGKNHFNNIQDMWSSANAKSITAEADGNIYIKVAPNTSSSSYPTTGTYGILYRETNERKLTFVLPESGITKLTAKQWENGIVSTEGETWYSFDTATGSNYYKIWWNDSNAGDGSKNLDIMVSAWRQNGDYFYTRNNQDSSWLSSTSASINTAGTIYIRVTPKEKGTTGSFGITYDFSSSSSNLNNRPFLAPHNPIQLDLGKWKDAELTDTSGGEAWHSISITSGKTYGVWVNGDMYNQSNGDGSKTLLVSKFIGYYSDGTSIFERTQAPWLGYTFTASQDGIIYILVCSSLITSVGTYGIVCAEGSTRPLQLTFPTSGVTPLIKDKWADGTITAAGEAWYSFSITASSLSNIWMNDASEGNGTKDLDVLVSAWLANGDAYIYNDPKYNDLRNILDNGWLTRSNSGFSQPSGSSATVYVRVTPKNVGQTGTFGIAYTLYNRNYDIRPFLPSSDVTLTKGKWEDGVITSRGEEKWYSFPVTSGTAYLRVYPYYISDDVRNTGTFGIVYDEGSAATRPVTPLPNATSLTEGQWVDGNISRNDMEWFSFTATAATQYIHISFGTLNSVYVQLYDSDITAIGSTEHLYSYTRNINRTVSVGQVYYIRVTPYSSSGNGTYKIAFNASSTAPAQ